MINEHDDYLTNGEVFLASIGREPEEQEDEEEQEELEEIFDDNINDEEDEDGDPSLAGVENYE